MECYSCVSPKSTYCISVAVILFISTSYVCAKCCGANNNSFGFIFVMQTEVVGFNYICCEIFIPGVVRHNLEDDGKEDGEPGLWISFGQ
jgi:hypothetical protein